MLKVHTEKFETKRPMDLLPMLEVSSPTPRKTTNKRDRAKSD